MRCFLAVSLLLSLSLHAVAQPANCPQEQVTAPVLPLGLDLAGRVPSGTTGRAYVAVPMAPPGIACRTIPPPPMFCAVSLVICCEDRAGRT
jgi:hypothetical protein